MELLRVRTDGTYGYFFYKSLRDYRAGSPKFTNSGTYRLVDSTLVPEAWVTFNDVLSEAVPLEEPVATTGVKFLWAPASGKRVAVLIGSEPEYVLSRENK